MSENTFTSILIGEQPHPTQLLSLFKLSNKVTAKKAAAVFPYFNADHLA
jgi:hypothetical protein